MEYERHGAVWDIHSHLIPGVDDGAESMNMVLSMANLACEQGVRGIFATPHSRDFLRDPDSAYRNFQTVQAVLAGFFPELRLYLGCEVYCEAGNIDSVIGALNAGQLPSLNGTRYVLTEFSKWAAWEEMEACAEKLLGSGWIPVIAHVERYAALIDRMDAVRLLRRMGCRIQINLYSLEDSGDPRIRSWTAELVHRQMVDFVGTDMHRTYFRPPSVTAGMRYLSANCSPLYLEQITWKNAARMLAGMTIL